MDPRYRKPLQRADGESARMISSANDSIEDCTVRVEASHRAVEHSRRLLRDRFHKLDG